MENTHCLAALLTVPFTTTTPCLALCPYYRFFYGAFQPGWCHLLSHVWEGLTCALLFIVLHALEPLQHASQVCDSVLEGDALIF